MRADTPADRRTPEAGWICGSRTGSCIQHGGSMTLLGIQGRRGAVAALLSASVGAALCTSVSAKDFQLASGGVTGSWDTTLSYGQAWRIEDPDCNLIASANGGCGR